MRISELAARSGVPIGTIKYYLREGLLPPGRATSRTTAEYEDSHVERLRLVRALTDAGGLGIAAVRRVVEVLDAPPPSRLDLLATAQEALLAEGAAGWDGAGCGEGAGRESAAMGSRADGAASEDAPAEHRPPSRARRWAASRGWTACVGDPLLERFERAWTACEQAGIEVDAGLMDRYAGAMGQVALADLDSVPAEAEGAVRRVVIGTVMLEPVLLALRMMAQREESIRRSQRGSREAARTDSGAVGQGPVMRTTTTGAALRP
ncbi:MerR family transcriptional regulator [Brachybacterium sp. UNK5269]|uniref:MerR family transcriptional regulator n=1 Tax=Brachybacterium sp. UNK5269 TaxID=3408576 RepID=UPI003BB20B43